MRKLNQITTDPSLWPNIVTYSIVIKCYNRSKHPDAGKYVVDLNEEVKPEQNVQPSLKFYFELLVALINSYPNRQKVVDVEDIVNHDTHVDAVVNMIKQKLTKDICDMPDSMWQQQEDDGGFGVWFCNSVNDMLQRYKVPGWEELSLHVVAKLRLKAK